MQEQPQAIPFGREGQRPDGRNLFVAPCTVMKDGGLAFRSPRPTNGRKHEKTGFIDENDVRAISCGFFYTRPILRHPLRDPLFVAFDRSLFGLLARPAERSQQLGNVIDVITNAVVPCDHFGDPRTGPQVGRKPVGLGTFHQTLLKKPPLIGRQLGFRAGISFGGQASVTSSLASLAPTGYSPRTDTQRLSHLDTRLSLLDPRHSPATPAFQFLCAPMRSHATRSVMSRQLLYLYRYQ